MREEPIQFPSALLKRIRRFIRDNPQLGYEDEEEFIKSAVRTQMLEYKNLRILRERARLL